MFILDLFTPNLSPNSNLNFRRTTLVPGSNLPQVDNSFTTLPSTIDRFTPFQETTPVQTMPWIMPGRTPPSHTLPWIIPTPIDIDPGFNPNRPVFPIAPNPWERLFPRPAPPSDQEMIRGLDRINSLIDFVINSTEINGPNPRMLDKAHKVIKERLKKLTSGLDLETKLRIQEELDEAFAAAKEGDLSKLEAFQEKLKKIKEDYNNQPRVVPMDIPCGRAHEMNSPPVTTASLNQTA